jgi:hypothetical protein
MSHCFINRPTSSNIIIGAPKYKYWRNFGQVGELRNLVILIIFSAFSQWNELKASLLLAGWFP